MSTRAANIAAPDDMRASLQLVAREIAVELNEARAALEAFAEQPEDRGALHRFAAHVHLARGALRIAEVYGGALLAEEIEQVARYADAHSGSGRADADGLDALLRAMEQLPAYVDRVASGGRDVPLALLPLLNDLRAVRGGALLSEGTLLMLNLRSDEPARPAPGQALPADDLARRLRPRFQLALLGWIRGEQVGHNLEALAEIAAQFESHATTQSLFQLWWVVGAVVEALREDGLEGNASVKRLLGQVDRELRRLHDLGESAYSAQPPVELMNNLLFYVARARSSGPRVSGVRDSFHLEDTLVSSGPAEDASETLSAPSVRLMKTVAAAIREDLTRVKDVLDIFVRKGAAQLEDLVPQLEMLRKIADTLGVLGLGELRGRVQGEIETLQGIVDQRLPADDSALLSVAAALIAVEDSLDAQLVRQILPEAASAGDEEQEPTDEEFRQVQDAVLRECIINMARIKEAISQALGAPAEAQGLDQVPQLVRGITAGLLMLGRQRAVEVMEQLGRALGGIVRPDAGTLALPRLERLADAIVAVEYYMEMLQAGRPEPWRMLEHAEQGLAALEPAGGKIVALRPRAEAEATPPAELPAAEEQPAAAPTPEPAAGPPTATPAEVSSVAPAPPRVAAPLDAEFVQLFVEEARENIARLQALFPQWEENPLDVDALREVRRVFHTLKGSGRMVGAQRIGEFSWSVESLLNRVISQTLARSPEIVAIVREAVAVLPTLVEELEQGAPARVDIAALIARADALSGREAPVTPASEAVPSVPITATPSVPAAATEAAPVAAEPTAAAPVETAAETAGTEEAASEEEIAREEAAAGEEAAAATPAMDPVLQEIFRKETAGHVAVVRSFIERCAQSVAPHPVTEALYRACHTLSGIAKTAGARQGIKVAEPMERYVRKLYENGHGLPDEGLALLRDTVRGLENVVENVDEDTGFFPEHGRLVAGWHALERALDAELARLTEAGERTVAALWPPAEAAPESPPEIAPAEELTEPSLQALADQIAGQVAAPAEVDTDFTAPHEVLPPPEIEPTAEAGEVPLTAAAAPGPAPPEPEVLEPEPLEREPEFDADIAAIFSEEASELLEQADAALLDWSRDRADRSQVTELKRLLHTLKGGARMAGIRAMGDLSHEMESFLAALEAGTVASDQDAIAVLQAALDELHRMRDIAGAGQRIAPATELIARVHAVAAASSRAPVPEEPRVEAPAAAAPREPETAAQPVPVEPPAVEAVAEIVALPAPAVEAVPAAEAAAESAAEAEGEAAAVPEVEPPPPEQPAVAPPAVEFPAAAPEWEPGPAPAPELEAVPAVPAAPAELPMLPGREPAAPVERHELARVAAELLDELLNNAGEVSIFRARVEQQMTSIEFNLAELGRTVTRLREQLRKLELETEAQILFRHQEDTERRADFDPLELDRYSTIQQLSRALAESVSDVASIEGLLGNLNRETQNLLQQQGRVVADLQNGLMRTRMVPFQRHAQRLTRLVRQAAIETGKRVELVVEGASGELDRQVLERMLPPFEHMLRNAVVHGIESPEERRARGKPEAGTIAVRLQREGSEVVIVVEDDGAGMNVAAIRDKARHMGLLRSDQEITDEEALQLILEPGFSTADRLTQQAGRGVGMDVVATEVKKLGGGLFIESTPGRGARFVIRLPFTLAITQALIVRVHDELYALPVATVEGVARLSKAEIERHLVEEQSSFEYGGQSYRFQHLGNFLGSGPSVLPETEAALPVILVRAGEHSTALVSDELVGSREIVVKSVGPQVASVRGISGATILGDGRIVIILDMGALVRSEWRGRGADAALRPTRDERIFALVVDDSITVRRVTQRLLERNGMRVMTAKDGVDAMALLQEHVPDVILLDIEMPRMDGYEVAAHVRNDPRLADVPIIMITSRVGEKHRARAIELGVDDYLGKPYQESQLLDAIEPLVLARRRQPLPER